MALQMDGIALSVDDTLWHKDLGPWRVLRVEGSTAKVQNPHGVRRDVFASQVAGPDRVFGWREPLLVWPRKDERNFDKFTHIVEEIRDMLHE